MDPELMHACESISVTVGGTLAAKPLLEKLLGPSFDYVGKAMAELFARYGNKHLCEIFRRAAQKAHKTASPRFVNPRVLRAVVEDGSFADDPVVQEYFAGVLAASLSEDGVDDHAMTFLVIIRNLTRAQTRAHYAIYASLRESDRGVLALANDFDIRPDVEVFIGHDVSFHELGAARSLLTSYSLSGLVHYGLLSPSHILDDSLYVPLAAKSFRGTTVCGSNLGAELFLWAHNAKTVPVQRFRDKSIELHDARYPFPFGSAVFDHRAVKGHRETLRLLRDTFDACLEAKLDTAAKARLLTSMTMLVRKGASGVPSRTKDWLQHWSPERLSLDEIYDQVKAAVAVLEA